MELNLLNTAQGLKPLYDADFDEKKKLRVGVVYRATIRQPRNIDFHRKYFALINCAWEYQPEQVQAFFKNNVELFRKTLQMSAGFCERVFSIERNEWVDIPTSISFSKMDNLTFEELYSKVFDVILQVFLKHISREEFESNLINFM